MHGMVSRIEQEMQRDTAGKVRIHAAGNGMERICGKWIGGSILASLGSFHQLYFLLHCGLITGGSPNRSMKSRVRIGCSKSVVHSREHRIIICAGGTYVPIHFKNALCRLY